MIVVDTNTIAYFYLNTDKSKQAEAINARDPDWVVPVLWKSEFRNVLTLYMRRELLSLEDVLAIAQQTEAVMSAREFAVATSLVLELAAQSSCSAYDCEFVALAQELAVPLVTADKRVLSAFPAIAVSLENFVQTP